nr:DUF1499 domain-containing protein [Aliiroseovarius sp. S1339]
MRSGPQEPGTHKLPGGVKYVIPLRILPEGALDHLAWIASESPRSRIRYQEDDLFAVVTRSRRLGFPDITVAWVADGLLHIHAHLVYGKYDMGANEQRVEAWLDTLRHLDDDMEDEF